MNADTAAIVSALKMALLLYQQSARRTGRTSRTIDNAKDGDIILAAKPQIAQHIRAEARHKGKDIDCRSARSALGYAADRLHGVNRPVHFEHTWIEQYFLDGIEALQRDLEQFNRFLNPRDQDGEAAPARFEFK